MQVLRSPASSPNPGVKVSLRAISTDFFLYLCCRLYVEAFSGVVSTSSICRSWKRKALWRFVLYSLSCLVDISLLATNDNITHYATKKRATWFYYIRSPCEKISFLYGGPDFVTLFTKFLSQPEGRYVANLIFSLRHQIKVNRYMWFRESNDQTELSNNLSDFYAWTAEVQYLLRHD